MSYSGYAEDVVNVEIDVDTNPLDHRVRECNSTINRLTASVGAMNAAQCAMIASKANQVSDAIIKGFFQSVSADLSAQRMELQQKTESRLILLRKQAETLVSKQKTMQVDYQRTSARYQKLFTELNKELALRIHQINLPVFDVVKMITTQDDRMMHTDLVQTAVTLGKESTKASAQLNVAALKRNAMLVLKRVNEYLTISAQSEHTVEKAEINVQNGETRYLPAIFYEVMKEGHSRKQYCLMQNGFEQQCPNVERLMEKREYKPFSMEEREKILAYMKKEMSSHIQGSDDHSNRVRKMIIEMFNHQL
jgi:uncharacterized protein YoxC